jgi:hypothetical protein
MFNEQEKLITDLYERISKAVEGLIEVNEVMLVKGVQRIKRSDRSQVDQAELDVMAIGHKCDRLESIIHEIENDVSPK